MNKQMKRLMSYILVRISYIPWCWWHQIPGEHNSDVIMSAITSQITGVSIVYPFVCSGADQRKHESSASLAFVSGIHRSPVNSHHKGPVTRKMFPFHDFMKLSWPWLLMPCVGSWTQITSYHAISHVAYNFACTMDIFTDPCQLIVRDW